MNSVLEVLGSCRATRAFRADPVPRELVEQCLWAATRAPSPRNVQPWQFIVIDDRSGREEFARLVSAKAPASRHLAATTTDPELRTIASMSAELVEKLASVPVIVVVCGRPLDGPPELLWSALYGATQNFLVAARSLGLSSVLTTMHMTNTEGVRSALHISDDDVIAAVLPLGWPKTRPGPVRRRPLAEVVRWTQWPVKDPSDEVIDE